MDWVGQRRAEAATLYAVVALAVLAFLAGFAAQDFLLMMKARFFLFASRPIDVFLPMPAPSHFPPPSLTHPPTHRFTVPAWPPPPWPSSRTGPGSTGTR